MTKGTQNGFVTAGHCGKPGSATLGFNRRPQGTVQASAFPRDDFSWVRVNDDWKPQPLIGNPAEGTIHVYGAKQAVVGASVCLSGSGAAISWHCGTIQQRDVDITYPQGVVDHLTRTSACGSPGNSGGPALSIDQAQGVISGGSGSCDLAGFTYIQPIREILSAYDLTLMTSNAGPLDEHGQLRRLCRTFFGTLKSAQFVYQPHNRYYHRPSTETITAAWKASPAVTSISTCKSSPVPAGSPSPPPTALIPSRSSATGAHPATTATWCSPQAGKAPTRWATGRRDQRGAKIIRLSLRLPVKPRR